MRADIERRLAGYVPAGGVAETVLVNLDGPLSAELKAAMAAPGQHAAVLIGLVERAEGLHVLLTLRAQHLSHHPGQVAFPGGRVESSDPSPIEAALRESWEEIGLTRSEVSVAATLAEHVTGTGFRVTPVVGFVSSGFDPRPDPAEVEQVFEVPLAFVLDAGNYTVGFRQRFGTRFRSYELLHSGHLIWGATAAMLVTLRDIINQ